MHSRIIGIDCAAQDKNVGIAVDDVDHKEIRISAKEEASKKIVIDEIVSYIDLRIPTLLCLDAPLGWPQKLADSLPEHIAGDPTIEDNPIFLFNRETDRFIRKDYKKPLEIGADRIARTALAALNLLRNLRNHFNVPITLAWNPAIQSGIQAIEVYPAATAIAHEVSTKGCKDPKMGNEACKKVLIELNTKLHLNINVEDFCKSHHHFDAVLCVIAGSDFLNGECESPTRLDLAKKEGWIWVKRNTHA